jgi:hypothetical protein
MLECTMGSQGDFERRRKELQIMQGGRNKPITDEEVVESYRSSVAPNGVMRELLQKGVLAYIHGETLFAHGGITPETYGYVPFQKERIDDVHKWVAALNKWASTEIQNWITNPYWVDGRRGEFPPPKEKFDTHAWNARGGDRLMDYVVPGTVGSVIYSNMFDKATNFTTVPNEIVEKLNKGGIKRLLVGHQPHGFAPSIIKSANLEVIDGDTSYSDMKCPDNRGEAWCEIIIAGKLSTVRGEITGKRKVLFSLSLNEREGDPFVGRQIRFRDDTPGWWVKGRFAEVQPDGTLYILSKVNGFVVDYAYQSYAEVSKLLSGDVSSGRINLKQSTDFGELKINNRSVIVTRTAAVVPSVEDCVKMPAFEEWVAGLDPKMIVRKIEIQSVDRLGPVIRFMKIRTDLGFDKNTLPGIVFLRGASVAVLVVINVPELRKKYVLLEQRARAAVGKVEYYEIPAGQDEGGSFLGVVRNLLEEEAGIDVTTERLVNLNEVLYKEDRPIYLSPGASDEGVRCFLVELVTTAQQLKVLAEA